MDWSLIGREDDLGSVVDSISSGRSVLLTGASGVGKSRLADEVRAILETSHHVERIIGSPSLAELPFGAVAHLAGDAPLPEPSALVTFITRAIRRRAARRRIAVIIDDLNELDDGSLALVQNLLTHESIPVLAAVRTEGAGDTRVIPLWKDGLMERRQLLPLSRGDTDQLVRTIMGGVCASEMLNELWRLTEGHPLFIRELLLEGLDQGAIADTDGLWTVTGPLGTSQRVVDIVAARTEHLEEAEQAALGIVAICEPIPLEHARRLAAAETLESLESKRMIRLETTGDEPAIRTSHPLVGEVTVSRMPQLTRINATARLARVLLESPSPSFRDSMRASMWLLDAGEQPPPDAAINGARAALRAFDARLARRLAEAALASTDSQSAMVLLGRAHAAEADPERAITVLQDAQARAVDDEQVASAATALAEVYMFMLGDTARAIRELEKSLEVVSDPGPRAEISSHLMMAAGASGDFDLGLRIGPEVADRTDLPGPSQLNSVMAMTLTQTMTGRLSGIEGRLELGERLAERFSDFQPFAPDQVGMNRLLAHHALGELREADAFASDSLEAGVGLPGSWLFVTAISRTFSGNVAEGTRMATESETRLASTDPLGLEPLAHGIRALLESMAGNSAVADERIKQVESDPRGRQTRAAVWSDRAEAWTAAQSGDEAGAASLAQRSGDRAAAGTHYVWAAYAYHDAVRFDQAEAVVRQLTGLADDDRGPFLRLLADHALSAAERDLERLVDVAHRALGIGARALAAEAHAKVGALAPPPEQRRHAHLALHHYRRCAGFRSPMLEAVASPLTGRQTEIAELAAAGHSSKRIADKLHLSARTIDNHLRTVYRTFEIEGRQELQRLFPD